MKKYTQFEDYVNLKVPRDLKDEIKTAASKKGLSIINYLRDLIKKKSI